MACTRLRTSLAVALLVVGAACSDDAPSTNTVEGSPTPTQRTDDNLNAAATTPVAAGEDSIVQGNQPMQSFTEP